MSRLEIELIGSSLLIVYEGDPDALERAWELVEREGQGRGDGLDSGAGGKSSGFDEDDSDDEFGSDEDGIEGEEIVLGDYDPSSNSSSSINPAANKPMGMSTSKPGWFSGLIGGFGAEKKDGSTGFGLLDSSPPRRSTRSARQGGPTRSTRSPSPSPSSDDEASNPSDTSDDEEDTRPRPFTLRLIDFAHTRLVQGQGKDEGFLLGLESTMRLILGRLGELEGGVGEVVGR